MFKEKLIKDLVKSRLKNQADLASFKRKMAKKYKIACPSNIELLKAYHKMTEKGMVIGSEKIENLLRTRPVRSLSGIVNISVLTKPYPCPGKCLYCPTEKGIPKSYVSGEPAVERAKKLNFDPYLQVKKRLEMLNIEGHPTDKVELRIVGGTWSFYPKKYQVSFVKRCFEACNERASENLEESQKLNEGAKHRIVGLSVETRPDFINEKEIKWLRELGATMIELGVQSIYDDVLKLNSRGHSVKETILATRLLKDAGFKVLYQMMPNLLGSNLKRDEEMFKEFFKNPDFQPDLLKIYPCALLKESPLYQRYLKGKYKPCSEKSLINLIKKIKKEIPCYVRIQRISRDIPSQKVVKGPAKISNLRQIIAKDAKENNWQCKCIRCREVKENYDPKEKLYLFRQDYTASEGQEVFLSFENKNRTKLYALLRLRLTPENKAVIREIHTYGQLSPFKETHKTSPQHKGMGKKLMKGAENIAKREFNLKKIAVISGVGVRDYFRKLGYKLQDTYMIKEL